jgi:lipoprotein-anchoring transpeptidase ErfK/SrfK
MGNAAGSNKTPQGLHVICEKIGADAPVRAVFKSRKMTGEISAPGDTSENRILSRILRLRGLQPGINSGSGIDTYKRYIYIHGTNREDRIGTPIAHGCICMTNSDILSLFDSTPEGTLVYIN